MIVIAPVRRHLVVKASQSRAFTVFTADMSRWWPFVCGRRGRFLL
jgi:hypothetical protein